MRRFFVLVSWCIISLGCPTGFLRAQPADKSSAGWVDVLRNDPRLQTKVSYRFEPSPTAEELLDAIQKATGVPLSLAGQPEKGKLTFATTHAHNVPAWVVMESLALNQIVDGKWEKAREGYVLHGKQMDFTGPPPAGAAAPFLPGWAWPAIGSAVLMMAAGAFIIFRGRGKKAPSITP